jgi:hypothetical protein
MSSESLGVIAEALDAIFDVFADSPVADVASGNIELLAHLEKVVPVLKSRVRAMLFLLLLSYQTRKVDLYCLYIFDSSVCSA